MRQLRRGLTLSLILLLILLALLGLIVWELFSSDMQAKYLAKTAQKMTWRLQNGPSDRIRFPGPGPYDMRLGYNKLPVYTEHLARAGWDIERQAKISIQMERADDLGLNLPYREKSQGGLTLLDQTGKTLYLKRYPNRVYANFDDAPPVLRNALLFIENRELLSEKFPTKNPAVEWDRLAQALLDKFYSMINPAHNVPGGSTLPTQIEKYRHSPDGITLSMMDKLKQMGSASLRAYLDGENTLPTRKRIVTDYLNTVPLSAAPGFGEVNGVGDGLWAWYGLDFKEANKALWRLEKNPSDLEGARAFKHALSLLVAERKPSYYLSKNRDALERYTNVHLDLLVDAGLISTQTRDAALKLPLRSPKQRVDPPAPQYTMLKATNSLRSRLAGLLGEQRLYDLDRLDLVAESTLNEEAQRQVTSFLLALSDPEQAASMGLYGKFLMGPFADLGKVIYSFTLYEKSPQGMLLRVQADNLNQPFDINQQTKLDLGSTAKLRTLVTYLEIIARLHAEYTKLAPAELKAKSLAQRDVLAQWVAGHLLNSADKSLEMTLSAAMARRYSASPQVFYTGGGQHVFANFNKDDNDRIMDVWEATRNSVNLVFIRIMRDIATHYMERSPGAAARVLDDVANPLRQSYLLRFVDKDAGVFLRRFHQRHGKQNAADMAEDLYQRTGQNPRRFTSLYRYLEPRADLAAYVKALRERIPATAGMREDALLRLYEQHDPVAYSLADRGYVTQIHPLEIWLVSYLRSHPGAGYDEVFAASAKERVAVYDWLFKTGRKNAQDIRIQSLLEVEAFEALLKDWKRLGYPFDTLTPSYATAIGSSGDRPAALAELMGIIVNDGVRLPSVNLKSLKFAVDTPYETHFRRRTPVGEVLFPKEVARTLRKALGLVVDGGTAARLHGALRDGNGNPLPIGGKTGTGDHRFERFGPGGQLLESRVVNRTATFVFYIGERHFGTLTALVPGRDAEKYQFTSSLTAQILKNLLPKLQPILFAETLKATPIPEQGAAGKMERTMPAKPAQKKPAGEAMEGTTNEAHPANQNEQPAGGFPDDLDPVLNQTAPSVQPASPMPPVIPSQGPASVASPAK
ncbi:MAG: transglycosylase domain-containing protein [Hydrogenophilaceae bacterium]|nr:transglycosylase domain-containing protein [Hydrogenophilaceae bacterium]